MVTLTLKKKAPAAKGHKPAADRPPLRGKGVSRPRQTLAQVQAEREERQAQRQLADKAPRADRRDAEGYRADRAPADRPRSAAPSRPARSPRDDVRRDDGPRGGFGRDDGRNDGRDRIGTSRPGAAPDARRARPQEDRGDFRQDQRRKTAEARPFSSRQDAGPDRSDRPLRSGPPGRTGSAWPRQDAEPRTEQRRPAPPRRPTEASVEGERLSKRMSELGLASRREADEWIAAGWVRVDGRIAELGLRVGPDVRIEIDPAARQQQAKQVTILLHKPIGYVSGQAEDGYEPASVLIRSDAHWKDDPSGIKFHIGHARSLAPAGRLDIDSTGLLVLTQDGRVAKLLIGEDSQVEKEYLVRVEYVGIGGVRDESGRLPDADLARLNHGLELDGVQLRPAKVSWANEDQLRFVLREGRKRQIRRMCELVGLKVTALKRVRIGRIPLGHLPPGQWRYLAPWERFD